MGAIAIRWHGRVGATPGERLRAALVFAGASGAAFMVTRAAGELPFGLALVLGAGFVVGTVLFFS